MASRTSAGNPALLMLAIVSLSDCPPNCRNDRRDEFLGQSAPPAVNNQIPVPKNGGISASPTNPCVDEIVGQSGEGSYETLSRVGACGPGRVGPQGLV